MPMYSYRCEQCGETFEELVSMDRRDQVACPKCGGPVRRAWEGKGVFGIDFSGGGKERPACAEGCPHAEKCGRAAG